MPKTSRIAAAAVAGVIALAMVPLQLIARTPAQSPAPDAHVVTLTALAPSAAAPAAMAEASLITDESEPQPSRGLTYVLFLDEGRRNTMMSGSTDDIDRAQRFRRNGERLLWFRHNGKEYVVRDAALIQQVDEVWKPVRDLGEQQGEIGAKQGVLGAKQGELGAKQGELGAQQGVLGAKQGVLGSRQGVLGSRQAGRLTEAEQLKIEREMNELDGQMRELGLQMDTLGTKMEEFERPMRDLGEQMDVLGKQMDVLGRKMDEASAKAEAVMRTLIERAVSSGTAQEVK